MIEAYHVTPFKNLVSILEKGLIPNMGDRSNRRKESRNLVYLFPCIDDMENALTNWLGDEFEDEERLVLLKIFVDDDKVYETTEWELVTDETILPHNIIVVNDNI